MPFNLSQIFGGWRRRGDAKRAARVRASSTSDVKSQKTSDVFPARTGDKEISDAVRGAKAKFQSELANKLLIAPHVSEKATMLGDGAHVFKVADCANKSVIKQAIEDRYGVNVESVNVAAARDKERRRGQTLGVKAGFKKAIIKLKKGQIINEF